MDSKILRENHLDLVCWFPSVAKQGPAGPRGGHIPGLPLVYRQASASEAFPEFHRASLTEVTKCTNKNSQQDKKRVA